jgi:hypothetical protein
MTILEAIISMVSNQQDFLNMKLGPDVSGQLNQVPIGNLGSKEITFDKATIHYLGGFDCRIPACTNDQHNTSKRVGLAPVSRAEQLGSWGRRPEFPG